MSTRKRKNLLGIDLDKLVRQVVSEETRAFSDEKSLQKKKSKELKPFKHRNDESETDEGEGGSEGKPKANIVKVKKDNLPEITVGKIIDLINMIRSGKSLKDDAVLKSLKNYYQRLNGSERTALYAFLTGISGVVVDVEESDDAGDDANTPSEEPFSISMKKDVPKEKKSKSKPSGSSENPIVVGESADKSKELQLFAKYR